MKPATSPLSTYDIVSSIIHHPVLRRATQDVLIDMAQKKIAQHCNRHLSRDDVRALIMEMA